jgi:hypothetical protein
MAIKPPVNVWRFDESVRLIRPIHLVPVSGDSSRLESMTVIDSTATCAYVLCCYQRPATRLNGGETQWAGLLEFRCIELHLSLSYPAKISRRNQLLDG